MKSGRAIDVVIIGFWPGKALLQKPRETLLLRGSVPNLLQGIIFRDVNSTQNLGPTISFYSKNTTRMQPEHNRNATGM